MAKINATGIVDIIEQFQKDNPMYGAGLNDVTLANVLQVQTDIANNPPAMNAFFQTLFNKIMNTYVKTPMFENKLARFKRASESYGDTIEEVFIHLIEERVYSSDAKGDGINLLSTEDSKVEAAYHKINRDGQYKSTILQKDMRKALVNPGALEKLINNIISTMATSNQLHEYEYMKSLLDGAVKFGETYFVEVGDIKTPEGQATFLRKAREYFLNTEFVNTYNPAGVETSTKQDELTLFMSTATRSAVDTGALASAFNMGMLDFNAATMNLDSFTLKGAKKQDDNVVAIMVEDSFFVVQDVMAPQVTSAFFPDTLKTNYFLTVSQIISRSPFSLAIAFVKKIPVDLKRRLNVSTQAMVFDSDSRKERSVTTDLEFVDGGGLVDDYDLKIIDSGERAMVTHVVDGKNVTFTLKDDQPAGMKDMVTLVAIEKGSDGKTGKELSRPKDIALEHTSRIVLK